MHKLAIASVAAAALAGTAAAVQLNDVYLRLDYEGEPYGYACVDISWAPGTSKCVQTGVGPSTMDNPEITFPDPIVGWLNVPDWSKQTLEIYIYGEDKGRPDSKLGKVNIPTKTGALRPNCVPVPVV